MADMQSALRARIVAALPHGRVYWASAPQGSVLPYVRLATVSDPRPLVLKGYRAFRETGVQVDVFARGYGEARGQAEAIITALLDPVTVDGVRFGPCRAEGPRDLGEDVPGSGYIHRASVDLLVWHSST